MKLSMNFMSIACASLVLWSCSNKEAETQETAPAPVAVADSVETQADDTTRFKFDFAIANIPSPASSMQEVASWKVPYDNTMLSNPQNVAKYQTELSRSLNLGIYNIDMAYAMMSNKGPEVLSYMKSILQMSDVLGLKNAVDGLIGKRAESNLNSKDTLFAILDEIFVKSDAYLRSNQRVYTAATVFAGSWIENLYLSSVMATKITDEKAKVAVRQHLWDQRFHLGNLINLLGDFKSKKECADLIAALKPIHTEISAFHEATEISDAQLTAIGTKIIDLRNKIVN